MKRQPDISLIPPPRKTSGIWYTVFWLKKYPNGGDSLTQNRWNVILGMAICFLFGTPRPWDSSSGAGCFIFSSRLFFGWRYRPPQVGDLKKKNLHLYRGTCLGPKARVLPQHGSSRKGPLRNTNSIPMSKSVFFLNVMYGKNVLSAKLLEVYPLGVGNGALSPKGRVVNGHMTKASNN